MNTWKQYHWKLLLLQHKLLLWLKKKVTFHKLLNTSIDRLKTVSYNRNNNSLSPNMFPVNSSEERVLFDIIDFCLSSNSIACIVTKAIKEKQPVYLQNMMHCIKITEAHEEKIFFNMFFLDWAVTYTFCLLLNYP